MPGTAEAKQSPRENKYGDYPNGTRDSEDGRGKVRDRCKRTALKTAYSRGEG